MTRPLGEFEQIVLLALLRLGDAAYGVAVQQEITQRTRRDTSLGSVYATLARLEEKGLVAAHLGDPTPERGGRRKKFFRISRDGRAALQASLQALGTMAHGLDLKWRPG